MAACGASSHRRWEKLCDKPATPSAGLRCNELPGPFIPHTVSWAPVLGRLVKVCLPPFRSLLYGSGQIGLVKCNCSANSSPVLGASGVGPPGSDTEALCLSRKQHQNASAVEYQRADTCLYVCKWKGLFRGRGPGFWSHLFLILSKRW